MHLHCEPETSEPALLLRACAERDLGATQMAALVASAEQQIRDGVRRILDADPSGVAAAAGSGKSGGDSGFVGFMVLLIVLIVAFVAWRLWRVSRWWRNRARSAKVLDEIEMEFVNDDADEVMEDVVLNGNMTRGSLNGGGSSRSGSAPYIP